MSERDLIERLAIRAARFEASPGNDLIYGQGEAQTDKEAAATIARLSEALAEAEKKGAEAYEEAARIAESFINPNAFTREQQAASDTAGNIADMILFNAPPRDLSQGGRHG